MRPERYPTLVALEPFGFEYLRESLLLRIDQTLRRMCQCIGHCVLLGAALFSDSEEPTFFCVIWHGLMVYRNPAWVLP